MASEDVIELGSSDEDTEPAPKKAKICKPSKPPPNAMVCIPNKFRDVTIKPSKPTSVLIPKVLGKSLTVTKVPTVIQNPFANKNKINGKFMVKSVPKTSKARDHLTIQPKVHNIVKSSVPVISVSKIQMLSNPPVVLKNPIKIQSPRTLNLPPSITVKRTAPLNSQIGHSNIQLVKRKKLVAPAKVTGEVLTVELDDDEGSSSTSGPRWYLRPEDQEKTESKCLEEENNKEPEAPKQIEIIIEDSPVKPLRNKRPLEVGNELAITIDDSPQKPVPENNKSDSDSDDARDTNTSTKVPHSKKKLKYPKESGSTIKDTIEIEIEPIQPEKIVNSIQVLDKDSVTKVATDKQMESSSEQTNLCKSAPNKTKNKENKQDDKVVEIIIPDDLDSEFHHVYQHFIDLCFQLEDSEDMKKIVEKKIKAYYRQVPKHYTESEEFVDMVSSKIVAMKAGPEKMYLYIKDIVDELNLQRKLAKSNTVSVETSAEPEPVYGEKSDYDSKRQRKIRKLEKTIKKLHRAIQKLEEQEVDFDDDEDSVYLLTERYKERMVRVYAKFCQMTNTKMPSEPRILIDARQGRSAAPAKLLEKWINKKVPIGTPLPFPDFHDVLRCVRDANEEEKLGWNEVDIMEEARDLFTRCGKKLQRRRQENEWRIAASRLTLDVDPAEKNIELKKQLESNKQIATEKEIEIFNKYANRQNQLKLEPVEIGDKEAEESPVESEDEEANEDEGISLDSKEKRKERLKRLLHENSNKDGGEKEDQPEIEFEQPFKPACQAFKTSENVMTVDETQDKNMVSEKQEDSKNETDTVQLNNENRNEEIQAAQSISDDSNIAESDIGEGDLLQKLYSGNEALSSTQNSSDSDSPIAISDTLESSGDNKQKASSDVISIENSSYSEPEVEREDLKNDNDKDPLLIKKIEKFVDPIAGIECSSASVDKAQNKTNNDEYNESVEDILLASSDDESQAEHKQDSPEDGECVNLRDDLISIDETIVDSGHANHTDKESVESSLAEGQVPNDINSKGENSDSQPEQVNEVMEVSSVEEVNVEQNVGVNDDNNVECMVINDVEENEKNIAAIDKVNVSPLNNDETVEDKIKSTDNIEALGKITSPDAAQDEVLRVLEEEMPQGNVDGTINDTGLHAGEECKDVVGGDEENKQNELSEEINGDGAEIEVITLSGN